MSVTKDQTNNKRVEPILIEDELKNSFLDYAMSVIVSRALPDVRDGLKPVHRRILYSMNQSGFHYNRPYHKSVRIVGDVLGKYHPHGDSAVYNTMVGMVQDFSKRYPLLDGQGNWGSVDGDSPAAMRYTEVRMQKISQEILADLDKATVAFVPNFDESTVEPVVLPSRLPNLLVNGTSGIAVGMATSIPPHNLREIIDACLAYLTNEDISDEELLSIVPAPDFPTGGIICGRAGIVKAYKTGRGSLTLRGVAELEETKKGSAIVITQLPYQVNKSELVIKIAELVKNKVIEGISNLRDESDKKGMRLVVELKRGEIPQVTLNQLYKFTTLQQNVTILMLGLLDNKPIIFSLRELIREFVHHRQEVVYKRTIYDLERAKQREHILHGFIIALDNIDELVALIKQSESPEIAIDAMHARFKLSAEQAKAILEMRLQRLTGLEQEKIRNELGEIKGQIAFLNSIIQDKAVLIGEIAKELNEVRDLYGDDRRTRIAGPIDILTEADLIPEEDVVVTLTRKGYIKRVQLSTYGVQHRGGKGKMAMTALDEGDDMVLDVFVALTHDDLLFFTNLGRVYNLRVFEVPEASRMAKGRAIVNLLPLQEGEQVVKLLRARDLAGKSLVMLSKNGVIKRTEADQFEKIRTTGIRACSLREDDELVFCALSSGTDTIVIATAKGAGIRFKEDEVRVMGRQAAGVRGIRLRKDDYVIGMQIIPENDTRDILFATSGGYGKRVRPEDFRVAHRGGYGVRTIPTDARNGMVIGLAAVSPESNILLIDEAGKMIRLSPTEIRTMGRQAKGVRLIKLDKDQHLAAIVAFEEEAPNHEGENNDQSGDAGTQSVTGAVKADALTDNEQDFNEDALQDDIKVVFDEPDYDDDYADEDDADEDEDQDNVSDEDDTMVF